ncbi:MAG: pilus assembly protein TadG-related protein [Candidatus Sphingomonas colombiensis]|nr:pilus assembly protein TadG-related protein [Sphingomonas sp.]WEK42510.1 MAG: pilus assembly protein TadG-related protein [Sphingomonas sp.]
MRRAAFRIGKSESGSVAPIVAIALFAVVGGAGIAFDYARLAALDTELQNAADHAALAAAAQLDGKSGAQTRATSSAQNLITNLALFANDGTNRTVTVPTVTFYQDKAKATLATGDGNSNFVQVTVGARRAFYALTPVVGALQSGLLSAKAFAGVASGICKVPPVMICNPQETSTNKSFDPSTLVGAGLNLVAGGAWTPGNFGFLDTGGNGAKNLSSALGWISPPGDCQPVTGVTTEPGANASVLAALNTRFDIYDNGAQTCPSGGVCPPSANAVKDLVRKNGNGNNVCTLSNSGWQVSNNPYLPSSATTPLTNAQMPDAMGYPRDMCHAVSSTGTCANGRIGNGSWDRNAYFYVNYGSAFDWRTAMTNAGYNSNNVTRYQVYQWELTNAASRINTPRAVGSLTSYGAPICWSGSPSGGIAPGGSNVDRRRISAAVINCQQYGVNGKTTNVPVQAWVELFLVEPSAKRSRTGASDIYAEIIGETNSGNAGGTAGQVVRKDVPYLIE